MQDALIRLTAHWAGHGCLVAQPMNTEVGAGTLNPSTALRVLGPEPWRVAYTEPSVRPDDSRYGDNPNRLQTHTQFQVILKPEPGDAQELYLASLAALGVDLRAHDVRFVEDDWASPALGAWGLGWEVWLDGLEITQFTYFQQSGGLTLDPVSVEITYGMERIMMALQGVSHFTGIAYAPGIGYGEAFGQAEYEMSRYYLDDAGIGTNRELFEAYAAEARRMLDARLPVPAHSQVLKCSHAFNVLDARGAIGTTERARAFARMRGLAHEVAELWVERRAELGHPLGDAASGAAPGAPEVGPAAEPGLPEASGSAAFALEIGVEELPPDEVARTAADVAERLMAALEAAGLFTDASSLDSYATPRRIIAVVSGLEPREPDAEQVVKGPRLAAAYDADGAPARALLGFARGQRIEVADVRKVTVGGGEYAGYVRTVVGRPVARVLAELVPALVGGLRAGKNMRWNAPGLSFARPIRWVLALLDGHEVPCAVPGLAAGRATRVHRTADEPLVPVPDAASLIPVLRAHGIEPDPARRRTRIVEDAASLARHHKGTIDFAGEQALVEEIVNLVEEPVAVLGSFDEKYLGLPEEILTTVMRKHQRYLPVRGSTGRLLPHFVTVANGECDHDAVRAGNEAVLRARYEDASFFFQQDLRSTPEEIKRGLDRLTFTDRLGSMADRSARIRAIAAELAGRVALTGEEEAVVRRAAELAKFDLASSMVIELPGLAGTMAREYARRAGEDEAVALALHEMELPRSAGDAVPAGIAGALLGAADRLDLLAGLFAVGSAPTGSSDPFGLRRAALALTAILRAVPRLAPVTVGDGLAVAARHQPVEVAPDALAGARRFVARRLEQNLLDEGHAVRVVRAVLPHADAPAHAERAAADLATLLRSPRFEKLTTALQRVLRIVPDGTRAAYDAALFQEPAERRLHEAYSRVRDELPGRPSLPEFSGAASALADPIDAYFDDVMVMDEDPALRANRLGFLAAVRDLVGGVLGWREIT
ncbi:glycine--tRNA ligase [Actinomadura rubrisoli]|uniref:Multifunctional fusion protein n=1 Tax=Actinomadura rubrisoli TaxID=2530368 RepID=A0A4R5BW38_9ACTN|nr:glycine--tRNA ligase [Actinomadura rubrisoli]TDD89580.1 glycine--tRNA ligase [Actinomadura rubrisoli]